MRSDLVQILWMLNGSISTHLGPNYQQPTPFKYDSCACHANSVHVSLHVFLLKCKPVRFSKTQGFESERPDSTPIGRLSAMSNHFKDTDLSSWEKARLARSIVARKGKTLKICLSCILNHGVLSYKNWWIWWISDHIRSMLLGFLSGCSRHPPLKCCFYRTSGRYCQCAMTVSG